MKNPDPRSPQTIETLKKRYEQLRDEKTGAAVHLKNAEFQLSQLQAEAQTKYGTDDLAALQAKLAEMKTDNERKCSEYQAALDKIQADLAAVESKYRQGEA